MASDPEALRSSALQKLEEFRRLRYPIAVLRGVCSYLAAITKTYTWIQVRSEVDNW